MPRFTTRAAIIGALLALVGSLVGATAAPAATRQDANGAVILIPTPPPSGVTSTRAVVPTGAESGVAATTGGNEAAVPLGPAESVIGSDGRSRVPYSATSTYPLSAIGQIELTQGNGAAPGPYRCTGWLIDKNSVLTSGHCSVDPPRATGRGDGGGPVEQARFFPGRNRGGGTVRNPFGSCPMETVWAPTQWVQDGLPQFDFSVQNLASGCDFSATAGTFGMFSLDGKNAFAGRSLRVEGYPADRPFGSRWTMAGVVDHSSNAMLSYTMDTAAGQSGSPVFRTYRASCGGPCGAAVHSYGVAGNPPTNSGPRLTASRISQIVSVANLNGA